MHKVETKDQDEKRCWTLGVKIKFGKGEIVWIKSLKGNYRLI
jgi:hypothetical protein